ncbi:MAG: hypothetical protein JO340_12520 [Acidobacteriaceae bacterium]|nr:hypothetical protein [Acidobacteriaceae bacterium]
MASIQLTNETTLDITASAADGGATLNRYLKNPLVFFTPAAWDSVVGTKIGNLTAASFPLTASAKGAGNFSVGEAALNVQSGASVSLGLLTGDDKDEFCASIHKPNDPSVNALVSFTIQGTVSAGPHASVNAFSFGIAEGATITLANFCTASNADVFIDAAKRAVAGLTIPHDLSDLASLPVNAVCRVGGSSSLKFSASVTYSFVNEALATKSISKLPSIAVKAKAGATVEAAATHTGSHTITIAKIAEGKLHLAVDLTKTDDFETSLTVSAGLTAEIGTTDALAFLSDKISPNASDESAKIAAEMPAAAAKKLRQDVKAAIDAALSSSLQISLKTALEESRTRSRLFTYEVDLNALDYPSSLALQAALAGDFTALTAPGALTGIRELDSALVVTSKIKHDLALRLLGVFNWESVNTFVAKSMVDYTKDTHEIVLSDQEIEIDTNKLSAEKLRQVLLKGVTLTIPASANTPENKTLLNIVFFDRKASADRSTTRQFVNILRAIGSQDAASATALLARNLDNYGTSSLYLALSLTPPQCRRLFLDSSGEPHDWTYYLRYACDAQATILDGDEASANRLKLFQAGDAFWKQLKGGGSAANQRALLQQAGIPAEAETDVLTFIWWASAMGDYAKALAADQSLEHAGGEVVTGGTRGFGEPWLIVATWKMLGNPAVDSRFTSSLLKLALGAF